MTNELKMYKLGEKVACPHCGHFWLIEEEDYTQWNEYETFFCVACNGIFLYNVSDNYITVEKQGGCE
jgi:uncharacterized protein YbaR (Trm112 family)